jgi:hypothetical protein
MKIKTPFIVAFVIGLFAISSCKKLYEYAEQHPTATSDACRITKFIAYLNGIKLNYNVSYDKKGNMISVLAEDGAPIYPVGDKYYRYDKHNKLTDYIIARHGNPNARWWDSYQYAPNTIFDSSYNNVGNIHDPTAPVNAPPDVKRFYILGTDTLGRIVNVGTTEYGITGYFHYTFQGNYYRPDALYDDKINPYRTSPAWQQTQNDYSANNPVDNGYSTIATFAKIVSYNAYGLPTKYVKKSGYEYNISLFGLDYDSLEVKYDCDISNYKIQ